MFGGGQPPETDADGDTGYDPIILARPRLVRRLDGLSGRRLVSVVAPAGAGKTTLVRQWAVRRDAFWHTVRDDDHDPVALCAALSRILRAAHPPGTSGGSWPVVEPAPGEPHSVSAALVADLADRLVTGLATAPRQPVRLVIDDVHLLAGRPGALLLDALARRLPAHVTLVLAGRGQLPFPVGELRSAGRVGELRPAELAFTPAEVRRVLRSVGVAADTDPPGTGSADAEVTDPAGPVEPVSRSTVHRIAADCDGHPGVVAATACLAARCLADGQDLDDLDLAAVRSAAGDDGSFDAGDLAALRALVALHRLAPPWRQRFGHLGGWALRRLADPRRLVAADLAAPRAARAVLSGPVGVAEIDLVLAESALLDRQHDEALRHVGAVVADTPLPARLAWQLGALLHNRGAFEAAESLYERVALDHPPAEHGPAPALSDLAQVLAGRAAARWARGDRERARPLAEEAVRVAERSRDDTAIAAAYVSLALTAFSEGDRAANEHAYARALAAAGRAGDVSQQLRIRSNVGSKLVEEGRYQAAVEQLTDAINVAATPGAAESAGPVAAASYQSLLALAFYNRAEARLGLGELEAARADADESLTLWQRDGSPLAAFGMLVTARVHQVCGSVRQATAAYREAVAMAEPDGNTQVLGASWAGLARTCYADDPAEATACTGRALALPSAAGPVAAQLAAGWIALCTGDVDAAARYAEQIRSEAGRRRDPVGLAEALELTALAAYLSTSEQAPRTRRATPRHTAALVEASVIWTDLHNDVALATNEVVRARCDGDRVAEQAARERLHRLGVRDGAWEIAGPLAALGPPPVPDVAVQTLGHFAVRLAGVAVPAPSWQSRKARDLVKLLAGHLGRPVPRDTVAGLLWPQAGAEVALRRLSVLISTVRAVLDPDRRHPAGHYLASDPATVRLDPAHVALDTVRFHDAARAVLAADGASRSGDDTDAELLGRLESVAATYTGDFCDDGETAGEWIDRPRAALADLNREVVRRLARRSLQQGRPDAAAGWYLWLAGEDHYDEAAHLGLVTALSDAGRHGEAARRYREYQDRMREIDVTPAQFPAGRVNLTGLAGKGRRHLNIS